MDGGDPGLRLRRDQELGEVVRVDVYLNAVCVLKSRSLAKEACERGKVKVSLRSTGRVSIDGVCTRFGGGGHAHAAGVLMHSSREEAKGKIIPQIRKLIDALEPAGSGQGA